MSEYQYYKFVAIDRPLTRNEVVECRSRSSRATITATRFVNEYNWCSCRLPLQVPHEDLTKRSWRAMSNAGHCPPSGRGWAMVEVAIKHAWNSASHD
ncbi:hypothetical protein D3871_03265 [Noviherbaspirillum saxi]|uniref:Uncharacterized protein n=1 Tax=Noviherbaspirillum saxi TaxID=2320863 RepID=A0A3A3FQB1_9BURK|nr:hypothetical protein D3871_03265 [Noviherbaspirillum saxi]